MITIPDLQTALLDLLQEVEGMFSESLEVLGLVVLF